MAALLSTGGAWMMVTKLEELGLLRVEREVQGRRNLTRVYLAEI